MVSIEKRRVTGALDFLSLASQKLAFLIRGAMLDQLA